MVKLKLLTDATVACLTQPKAGYDLCHNTTIAIRGETIDWVGPSNALPPTLTNGEATSAAGRLITPALIDCHTHIVYGGQRADEFEMRLQGKSYADIARAGGGIMATVEATRNTNATELLATALKRADTLIAGGVATIEVKSGYGLDLECELKMLRVARTIAEKRPLRVITSFLGAHAIPTGMDGDTYIDTVCLPALAKAQAEGLVDAVDGFCEGIAFDTAQIARVFAKAQSLGLPVKLHADQLSNAGGTRLAAKYRALSCDHLEYANEVDVKALAAAGSVAVLLPGAFYTLGESQKPPIEALRAHGVPMAVATDWNPGSSPLGSVQLAMNMACTLFGLTPTEALAGVTRNAAQALGLADCGRIAPGLRADLAIWDVSHPAELSYHIGNAPLHARIFGGEL